jgi:hypothetical protein
MARRSRLIEDIFAARKKKFPREIGQWPIDRSFSQQRNQQDQKADRDNQRDGFGEVHCPRIPEMGGNSKLARSL